jgi:hypothetical protein
VRSPARLLSAIAIVFGGALCLLLAACSGGSIQGTGSPGSVTVYPPDAPAPGVQVQPTWDVPAPTMLPTPTPTPVA